MPFIPDSGGGSSFKPESGSSFKPDTAAEPSNTDKLKAILLGDMTEGGRHAQDAMYGRQGIDKPIGDEVPVALPAAGLPAMASKIAQVASGSAPARVAANTALGAARGALNAPEGQRGNAALQEGGKALAISAGGETLGHVLSDKLGDWLMQRAVGMRKYLPGVGQILMSEGVGGTKNMMANQVPNRLAQAESELQSTVKNLPGKVPATDLSDPMENIANKFKLPSGEVPANSQSEYDQAMQASRNARYTGGGSPARPTVDQVPTEFVDNAGNPITKAVPGMAPEKIGQLGAEDLLALKRQGDYPGYTMAGNKSGALEGEIMRAQADASRQGLSKLAAASKPPLSEPVEPFTGQKPQQTPAEILGRERALISANRALEKPTTIHQGSGSSLFFGKVPYQEVAESVMAHGANKLGQLGKLLANPVVVQSLFGGNK